MLINRHPADWKEALHASLLESDGQNTYALMDGVHAESIYPRLKKFGMLEYLPLYSTAPSADEETLGLGPILVKYNSEHRKQWDALIELTNGTPALSIIVSPEPIERVAGRLIPWCVVDADGYTLALSFADTRILPALARALTVQQRGEFFGPAQRWICPGRDASWLTLPVQPDAALPPAEKVELSAQQVADLMAASEADLIAYQLDQYISKPLAAYAPFDAHAMLTRWLDVADRVKIESSPDRIALCSFGLARPELADDVLLALLASSQAPRTLDETLSLFS